MTLKKTRKKVHKSQSRRPWSLRHKAPLHRRIEDKCVRKLWNPKLTVAQNKTQINPNLFQERLATEFQPTIKSLSEGDARIIARLIAKHGEDVDKMTRDIKVNRWQWTAREITKKIKLYKEGLISKPIGSVGFTK